MKRLKKLNLKECKILNSTEMKSVLGGVRDTVTTRSPGAIFRCRCLGGANPPYVSEWTSFYPSMDEAYKDVNRMCYEGGSCVNEGTITL